VSKPHQFELGLNESLNREALEAMAHKARDLPPKEAEPPKPEGHKKMRPRVHSKFEDGRRRKMDLDFHLFGRARRTHDLGRGQ